MKTNNMLIEHYKQPKKYHTRILLFLGVMIVLLLLLLSQMRVKTELSHQMRRALERKKELTSVEVALTQRLLELKKQELNVAIQTNMIIEAMKLHDKLPSGNMASNKKPAGSFVGPAGLPKRVK